MTFVSATETVATRSLSLLSVSLAPDDSEMGNVGTNLDAEMIRAIPMRFHLGLVDYIASQYGAQSWLEGTPIDFQYIAITIRPEKDKYGNDVYLELNYNARGHRCLIATNRENFALLTTSVEPEKWHEMPWEEAKKYYFDEKQFSEYFSVYMD